MRVASSARPAVVVPVPVGRQQVVDALEAGVLGRRHDAADVAVGVGAAVAGVHQHGFAGGRDEERRAAPSTSRGRCSARRLPATAPPPWRRGGSGPAARGELTSWNCPFGVATQVVDYRRIAQTTAATPGVHRRGAHLPECRGCAGPGALLPPACRSSSSRAAVRCLSTTLRRAGSSMAGELRPQSVRPVLEGRRHQLGPRPFFLGGRHARAPVVLVEDLASIRRRCPTVPGDPVGGLPGPRYPGPMRRPLEARRWSTRRCRAGRRSYRPARGPPARWRPAAPSRAARSRPATAPVR